MCFHKKRGVNLKTKLSIIISLIIINLFFVILHLTNLDGLDTKEDLKEDDLAYINIINNDIKSSENKIYDASDNALDEADELDSNNIVYAGLTLEELTNKINKSLNSTIFGKGELIATYSLEKNVDPYMATAIILQETGCKWNCSRLVNECNNVGGQKGVGCGSYKSYDTLDNGIKGFIDNLSNNYVAYGLTTPEQINPKYAEATDWAYYVNKYIEEIKKN